MGAAGTVAARPDATPGWPVGRPSQRDQWGRPWLKYCAWPSRTRVAACCAGQLRVVIVASMSRAGDVVYYATCACGQRWFGLNRAHSTCCHRTWDDAELFDAHRLDEVCRTPRSMRLVQNAQGVWMRRCDGLPRGA